MALERNPNSKNLFYVDPAEFPISSNAGDIVDLDESTGKFTFEILSGGTASIDADVGEPVAGKAFLIYVQRDLLRSIEYVRVQTRRTNGWFQRNFDDTNINGDPTLSGEDFAFWRVSIPSDATSTTVTISLPFINSMVQYAGPQGIAFTLASEALTEWESAYREAIPTVQYHVNYSYQQANGGYMQMDRDVREAEQGSVISITEDDKVPDGTPSATGVWVYNEWLSDATGTAGTDRLDVYFDWCESAKLGYYHQNADGSWPDEPQDTIDSAEAEEYWPILEELGFASFMQGVGLPSSGDDATTMSHISTPLDPASGEYVHDTTREVISLTVQPNTGSGNTNEFKACFKLNFTVTYHDDSATNADVVTDSLDYGATTPTAPSWTRDGYTLSGWTPSPSPTVTQDVTYAAVWQVATAQYHVDTYLQSAGSYPEQPSSTVARTGSVGETVSLTAEDKTPADGYAYDTGAANVESGVVTIDGSLHLKAYFKEQFSVTYTDGVSTVEVFPDQTTGGLDYGAATPAFQGTPTRTGYDFTGWTPEVAGTVTADATYAATWQIQSCPYQIRYLYQVAGSYDTGTAIVETSETRYGDYGFTVQATESDKTPTKPGYVLDTAYPVNGTTLTDKNVTAYVDVHFKQQFTVTYTDGVPDAQVFEDEVHGGLDYGTYTPTYDGTPTREDYTFTGWSPMVAQTVTADATYTAQWEALVDLYSYRVEYYYQSGGSYPGTASSYETRTEPETSATVSVTPEDKTPTRPGYVYDTAAQNVESAPLQPSGTVLKLYFKQQFTVTYTDGVSGEEVFADQVTGSLDYGATTPFFSGTPERYGYTFTGWSPSVAPTVTADATYTAQWSRTVAQYTVERYLQASGQYPSAATSSTTRSAYVGDTVELNVQDMTPPSGYTYDDDAANVEEAVLQPSGTVLRAYFKQKFTVTYTDGVANEQVFQDQTYKNLYWGDQTPSFTGTPEREGYNFMGWSPAVSATVQGDATYSATWKERPRPILTIGGKALSDFGECVASRNTGAPEKKTSTVTVPHMSGFWDFSKIYGALAYESREVTYTVELLGDDRADLQDRKSALMAWLLATHDQAIYDDDIKGWHFVGSCSSCEWEEGDEGESGTITATFLCQPFLYADDETSVSVPEGSQVVSNPGESLNPMAAAMSGTATVTLGGVTQSVTTTPTRLVGQLVPGDNNVTVSGGTVTLTWYETRI